MDDRYRGRRSPDRGTYGRGPPPPPTDSYVPGGRRRSRSPEFYRRRSRSPPRMQSDTWTPRARSPPRRFDPRDDYPPRDARPRSPRRGYPPAGDRYDPRTRSPQPPINRVRDFSPPNTRMRSPPPTRSDRVASPSRDYGRPRSPPRRGYSPPRNRAPYRARSRSPPRREDPYAAKTWRRRSPSPARPARSNEASGRNSLAASRRSSPRPPMQRPAAPLDYESSRGPPADYRAPRPPSPPYRRDSPPPAPAPRPERTRSPYNGGYDRGFSPRGERPPSRDVEREPPPPVSTDHPDRGAPTNSNTSAQHAPPAPPPTGPSSSTYNRPSGPSAPPSGPASSLHRGGYARGGYSGFGGNRGGGGGPPRDFPPRDYPPSRRGGGGPGWGTAPSGPGMGRGGPPPRSSDAYPARDPHTPRDAYESRPPPPPRGRDPNYSGHGGHSSYPHGGSANSTSSTYPRTQRFNVTAALSDLPKIKPDGERLPPLFDTAKAERLEEEAARLRKVIDDRAGERRRSMREWERLETGVRAAGERSEVVERELRGVNGEGLGGGVAF